MKRSDLALQVVPKYPELSVNKVWKQVKQDPALMEFFPDYQPNQLLERDYLFAIISTKLPRALRELIKESRASRSAAQNEDDDEEIIEIHPEIKVEIMKILTQKRKLKI